MFCTSCGTKNGADAKFCKECGHGLERTALKISEEAFERAMPDDEHVSALLERAYRLRREGSVAAAIGVCEEALQLRSTSTSAHSLLGQLYEHQGERDKAIAQYEYVLQLNPGSIADRVKLDALRDGTLPSERRAQAANASPSSPLSAPIMLNGRGSSDTLGRTLALVGGMAALLLLGGIFALQLNGRTEPARTTFVPVAGGSVAPPIVPPSAASSNTAPAAGAKPSPAAAPASDAKLADSAPSAKASRPVNVVTPPPQIIYQVTAPPRTRGGNPSGSVLRIPVDRRSGTAAGTNGDDKVRLNGDDESPAVAQNGEVSIAVKPTKGAKSPDGGTKSSPKSDKDPGQIDVTVVPPPGRANNPSSLEARSFLSMGNERKTRGDWNGAIKAFRNALGQSGDDAGYVYQQIGYCFQKTGDKNSALTNYERAISEYQKHSNSDAARDGIRVCQTGIRACN